MSDERPIRIIDGGCFIDAKHGWLITDSGRTAFDTTSSSLVTQRLSRAVYETTDGGLSWKQLASAKEGDRSTLGTLAIGCSTSGFTFVTLDRGWVTWDCNNTLGPQGSQQAPVSTVAVTQDGGHSWQPVQLHSFPPGSDSTCTTQPPVFTSSKGVLPVFCGGIGHAGFGGVYATTDSGRSWILYKTTFFSQQLDFVDANTGWTFVTPGMSLYRTTDGRRVWVPIKEFVSEQSVEGFRFVDSSIGFAVTSRYAPDGNSGVATMWKTADGGRTWTVMSSVPRGPRCC